MPNLRGVFVFQLLLIINCALLTSPGIVVMALAMEFSLPSILAVAHMTILKLPHTMVPN